MKLNILVLIAHAISGRLPMSRHTKISVRILNFHARLIKVSTFSQKLDHAQNAAHSFGEREAD